MKLETLEKCINCGIDVLRCTDATCGCRKWNEPDLCYSCSVAARHAEIALRSFALQEEPSLIEMLTDPQAQDMLDQIRAAFGERTGIELSTLHVLDVDEDDLS